MIELKKGQRVFQSFAAEFNKMVTEFEIVKVNPKTVSIIGENGKKLVKKELFENYGEGKFKDSFVQYSVTLQEADVLSIQLMDLVLARKFHQQKQIQKSIDQALEVRNSAPKIRRMQ